MYIVNAVVVLIILLAISTMLDPVFTSSINNADGAVKVILTGLDYLFGLPTDILAIIVKILFAAGVSVAI